MLLHTDVPNTAMAEAMISAGWVPPKTPLEQALDVALDAWGKWSAAHTGGARRDYVKTHLTIEMLWEMLEQHQRGLGALLVGALLNQAKAQIDEAKQHADRRSAGGGQKISDNHIRRAATTSSRDAGRPAGAGQTDIDIQVSRARATDQATPAEKPGSEKAKPRTTTRYRSPSAPDKAALAEKHRAATLGTVQLMVKLSRLDTVLVNGRAIGDCTVAEVRLWIAQRETDRRAASRDIAFAQNLVGLNLAGGELIRKWVKPEEADAYYDRAETEHAA